MRKSYKINKKGNNLHATYNIESQLQIIEICSSCVNKALLPCRTLNNGLNIVLLNTHAKQLDHLPSFSLFRFSHPKIPGQWL